MKTKVFLCPECSCSNTFNLDDSIETLNELNVNWLICNHCFNISDIDDWIKVNNSILNQTFFYKKRKLRENFRR